MPHRFDTEVVIPACLTALMLSSFSSCACPRYRPLCTVHSGARVTQHEVLELPLHIYLQPAISLPALFWALQEPEFQDPPNNMLDTVSCSVQKEAELRGTTYSTSFRACGGAVRSQLALQASPCQII